MGAVERLLERFERSLHCKRHLAMTGHKSKVHAVFEHVFVRLKKKKKKR
jgi:hypothetical protein